MLDHYFSSPRPLFSLSSRIWNPPTDIYETGEATTIQMEVAGLDENGFQIIAQHNLLIVRGRRVYNHAQAATVSYHLMEIHYGEFERVFAFSFDIDQNALKATYERGFLIIEVARQSPQVTRVKVEIVQEVEKF
jgi:HSP20 family protein